MPSMIYPATTIDGAAWLQRSVCEYFQAIAWVPPPVLDPPPTIAPVIAVDAPAIGVESIGTEVISEPPSLDRSVVQYFANFPWNGLAMSAVVAPTAVAVGEAAMLDPAAIADWLDFEPTVDPKARLDNTAINDPGSLADFSDFF
jgi:hypothetical protein